MQEMLRYNSIYKSHIEKLIYSEKEKYNASITLSILLFHLSGTRVFDLRYFNYTRREFFSSYIPVSISTIHLSYPPIHFSTFPKPC